MDLLLTPALYALEAEALAREGPGVLMHRAASALAFHAARILRRLPVRGSDSGRHAKTPDRFDLPESSMQARTQPAIQVWLGPGNNGGDALLAGLMLAEQGHRVIAVDVFPQANRPADAAAVFQMAQAPNSAADRGARLTWWQPAQAIDALQADEGAWLILDGLFGIGLKRPMQAPLTDLIQAANARNPERVRVLAVDIPSGLNADTGMPVSLNRDIDTAFSWHTDCGIPIADAVVRADLTLTFLADKPGLHTGQAAQWCGEIILDRLGYDLPPSLPSHGRLFTQRDAMPLIPRRHGDAHKGRFGDLLVIEGAPATQGAALLALLGAQAVGTGRLYLGQDRSGSASAMHPEFMARLLKPADPGPADAVVIGCGLGQDARARSMLREILTAQIPCVLDADALNLIAGDSAFEGLLESETPRVMTPHPLEAARLLGCSVAQVQADRIRAALKLARSYRSVIVLKGAGSVVADPMDNWSINASGGPLLAVAGTGDVLAGVIGGLMAQGLVPESAARLGTWLHGSAADVLSTEPAWSAGIGLPASRLPQAVRQRINTLAGASERGC
jgi:hydroxyethylthiazole kinase-like uncharacterized protein yjeF